MIPLRHIVVNIFLPLIAFTACNKDNKSTPAIAKTCRLTDLYTVTSTIDTTHLELLYDSAKNLAGSNEMMSWSTLNIKLTYFDHLIVCKYGVDGVDTVFLNRAGFISAIHFSPASYYTRQTMFYTNDTILNFTVLQYSTGGDTIRYVWEDGDIVSDSSSSVNFPPEQFTHFKSIPSNDAEPFVLNQLKRYGACYMKNRHMVASRSQKGTFDVSLLDTYKPTFVDGKIDFMSLERGQVSHQGFIPTSEQSLFFRYNCN